MESLLFDNDDEATRDGASSSDRPCDHCDPPRFPLARSIEQFGVQLDGTCFSAMHFAGDARQIWDVCSGHLQGTAVRACIDR